MLTELIDLQGLSMIRDENQVKPIATSTLPIRNLGSFVMTVFSCKADQAEHLALVKKPTVPNSIPLVRIHSECITGDVFSSAKCDCGEQLNQSLSLIGEAGGIIIYLRQEGRGIGLANKLKAYALQDEGFDTVDANLQLGLPVDNRDYAVAYQILHYMGVQSLRLLTNNPHKVSAMAQYGLHVVERVPLKVEITPQNRAYLMTKQQKLGHYLSID